MRVQTIVGVASTATHGGDVGLGAINDLVIALHLIAPYGQEYWIERQNISPSIPLQLVDPAKLADVYAIGAGKPGGAERVRENKQEGERHVHLRRAWRAKVEPGARCEDEHGEFRVFE